MSRSATVICGQSKIGRGHRSRSHIQNNSSSITRGRHGPARWVRREREGSLVVIQGTIALAASNRRTVGRWVRRESEVSLRHGGVGGAGTLRLNGDATDICCTGFDDLPNGCHCQQRWHRGKRMESRRGRFAGGDATGHAQRVPLAKVAMVLPSTPCGSR